MWPYGFHLLDKLTCRVIYVMSLCIPVKLVIAFSYNRPVYFFEVFHPEVLQYTNKYYTSSLTQYLFYIQ